MHIKKFSARMHHHTWFQKQIGKKNISLGAKIHHFLEGMGPGEERISKKPLLFNTEQQVTAAHLELSEKI